LFVVPAAYLLLARDHNKQREAEEAAVQDGDPEGGPRPA